MSRYSDQTTYDLAGVQVPLPGVTVYVYASSTGQLATITADGGGTLANPLTSDGSGNYYFNAPAGLYDLRYIVGGKTVLWKYGVRVGTGIFDADQLAQAVSDIEGVGTQAAANAALIAAAQAAVGPYALANVLRRISTIEDEVRQGLPTLTGSAYHAIYSTARLVPTYNGPAFRAIRNSDSVAVDVYFTGKTIAPGDIKLLRGSGSVLRIDKWYDQLGNSARDMTQTVANRRPGVHEDAYFNGAPVILFDGGVNFTGGPGGKGFDFTHALTGRSSSVFIVTDFKASIQLQVLFNYNGLSGGYRTVFHNYNGNSSIVEDNSNGPISTWVDKQFRAGMAVYGWREKGAVPIDLFINGTPYTAKTSADNVSPGSVPTAETLAAGRLGYIPAGFGFENYQANFRATSYVAIEGALTDADALSLTRALQTNYAIPSRFDSRVIIIGDSIAEGGANINTLELMWYLRQQSIKGLPEFYNEGISGKTLTACYTDRLLFDAKLYRAGDPIAFDLQGGINDIRNGVTGATLYATAKTYMAYLHGLGTNVKVVLNTLQHDNTLGTTANDERVAYNALVIANADADPLKRADRINDVDAALAAIDASYWTNVAILADGIHPTSYGYSLLAPAYAAAINAVLP